MTTQRSKHCTGLAAHELIVILTCCGAGLGFVFAIMPHEEDETCLQVDPLGDVECLPVQDIVLADDLRCTIRLLEIPPRIDVDRMSHICRVLIAHREPKTDQFLVLDIVSEWKQNKITAGTARVWTVIDLESAKARFPKQRNLESLATYDPIVPPIRHENNPLWSVAMLDTPLRNLAPEGLQQHGLLIKIDERPLEDLGEINSFPLTEATATIRRYQQSHPPPTDDLPTLLRRIDAAGALPTLDDAQALTHALLYGLLDYLPEE